VPQNDPAALAAGVLRLIERPQEALAMARAARREVRRFTWSAVRHRWRAVYDGAEDPPAKKVTAERWLLH
jgi:glycosyltransferase involved in cell wall biosynthesis